MRLALALVLLTACSDKETTFDNIVPSGGGGGVGGMRADAPYSDSGDASTTINGRVCLLSTNPQTLMGCATTGADIFTVTLDAQTTTTAADGTFTLMRPSTTTGETIRVSGMDMRSAALPLAYALSTFIIPTMSTADYTLMASDNTTANDTASAVVMVQVRRGTSLVTGATVTTAPPPDVAVLYDGATPATWTMNGTGTNGVAWVPSVAPGTGTGTITITAGQTSPMFPAVPLYADTITSVFAEIP